MRHSERLRQAYLEGMEDQESPEVEITPPEERNKVSGLIGMFKSGRGDLSRRVKDWIRPEGSEEGQEDARE